MGEAWGGNSHELAFNPKRKLRLVIYNCNQDDPFHYSAIMSSFDKVVKLACKPKAAPPKPKVHLPLSVVVVRD